MLNRSAFGARLWDGSNDGRSFLAEGNCSFLQVADNELIVFAECGRLVVIAPGA